MFADARFGYLERIRYGLGYATSPIYWVADIPTRVSFWIDDVFVSRTDLLEENDTLRANFSPRSTSCSCLRVWLARTIDYLH